MTTNLNAAPALTTAQRLVNAGFHQQKYGVNDCGEALKSSGSALNGLACKRPGTWLKEGEPGRCAQHALATI